MKKLFVILSLFLSCDTGNLKVISDIPILIREVSGIETSFDTEDLWMINDSGNKTELFLVSTEGVIQKVLKIDAKNRDWEDLTLDSEGNLYIGDFGNNGNSRKNLSVLKINKSQLTLGGTVSPEKISFNYSDQTKFPPKKKQRYFDCEAFIHYNDHLYLFTKSRVNNDFGRTNLYKIPDTGGTHEAQYIGTFKTCDELPCWITAADISQDGKTLVLLSLDTVWTFTDFENDNFFSGKIKKHDLDHRSQKESICFKNNNTIYIADEYAAGTGGNLYEFTLNSN